MRAPVIFVLAFSWSFSAFAAVPSVEYEAKAGAGSWRPIQLSDIRRTIEHAALEVLTRPGLMQLAPVSKTKEGAVDPKADYELEIQGRLLDEAETHTVYLSFGPGNRGDLPSIHASHSVTLRGKPRGEMLTAIDKSARTAATQLIHALEPHLRRASPTRPNEPPKNRKDPYAKQDAWPWSWSEVHVPGASFGKADKDLFSKDHGRRTAAFRLLASKVVDSDSARNTLERCVLEHPDKTLRLSCLEALRAPARSLAQTQRVVVEALRRDSDRRVRTEASEQMTYFTGAGKEEAVQAWLEQVAKGEKLGPIDKLGDLPNLDLALRSCLFEAGKAKPGYRTRKGCWDLFDPLSYERRAAILWRFIQETDSTSPYYLDGMGEREGSHGTDWQWSVETLLEEAPYWEPELSEILWRRYQRDLSASALRVMVEIEPASRTLAQHLLEVFQTSGNHRALWGLRRVAKSDPEARGVIVEKLNELLVTSAYPKTSQGPRILKDTLRQIEKEGAK